jgi:hypothetical protein
MIWEGKVPYLLVILPDHEKYRVVGRVTPPEMTQSHETGDRYHTT